jgi:hypothetical protein
VDVKLRQRGDGVYIVVDAATDETVGRVRRERRKASRGTTAVTAWYAFLPRAVAHCARRYTRREAVEALVEIIEKEPSDPSRRDVGGPLA